MSGLSNIAKRIVGWWRLRKEPERLLFVTTKTITIGDVCCNYHHNHVVTRIEHVSSGRREAWGKITGPATGPGTIGESKTLTS